MILADLVKEFDLQVRSAHDRLGNEVTGGYASDLLSDVIAHAQQGDLWVTLQIHLNIVAVASMKEMAGIVLVGGREPEADTVERADAENIPIFVSALPSFELIGRLYALGLRGVKGEKGRGSEGNAKDEGASEPQHVAKRK